MFPTSSCRSYLLVLLLSFLVSHGYGQYKQVPDVNHERNEVNGQILKGHFKGYKVYDLEMFPDKRFDTIMCSDSKYNSAGLLNELQAYSYTQWEEVKDLEYWRKLGRFQQGIKLSVTYDSKGNMLSKRSTLLYPRNSYMAMMVIAMKPEGKQSGRLDPDSMLTKGVPEQSMERELLSYKYNKDGNPVSSFDSVGKTTTNYSYRYDEAKRVIVQRRVAYEGDLFRSRTVSEFHFSYDKAGNLDTIIAYRSFMDTVNVVSDRNRQYLVGRVYNDKGKVIREYATSQSESPAETVFTFNDTLNMGSMTIKKNSINDTSAITTNKYDEKKRLVEQSKTVFYEGKRYRYERTEYSYDAADIVTEIRLYSREAAATKDILKKKTVFEMY